jgi:hypothetical protein
MVKKKAKKKVTKKAAKKTCKKVAKKTAKKKDVPISGRGLKRKNTKGIGTKLAIYVPKEDEWVIDQLETIKTNRRKDGYRTSLSYELIRLVKERLQEL